MTATSFDRGFQGSVTTGCDVVIHRFGTDRVLTSAVGILEFSGRSNGAGDEPSLVAASTSKQLGAAAGSFHLTVRAPASMGNLCDLIVDDDWVDITFTVNGRKFHTHRGLVDTIREAKSARAEGISRTYNIDGREFGKILDDTQIWFNVFSAETPEKFTIPLWESLNIGGNPAETVEKILYGFVGIMTGLHRGTWLMPRSVPGAAATFPETVAFQKKDFRNLPARLCVSAQLMDPSGAGLWALAQEYSDPQFCELYCDLLPKDGSDWGPDSDLGPDKTQMTIVMRDRPHPSQRDGSGSLWFRLPVTLLNAAHVADRDIGRGGLERYNAFVVSPQVLQDNTGGIDLCGPLWDPYDIESHGLKKMSVDSRYCTIEQADLLTMSQEQRKLVRDWHVMNPYLYSGSLGLMTLRPDIHVGGRLSVLGDSEDKTEHYYVEQVAHEWQLGNAKTKLGVTRGWIGRMEKYMQTMRGLASRYVTLDQQDATSGGVFT